MGVILHILWTIIKVIGIILLSIIGLILFLLLFVLAAPISYQAQASYSGDIEAKARVYWLYHILKICLAFKEKELNLKISVFGLQLYPRKKKAKKAEEPAAKEDSNLLEDSSVSFAEEDNSSVQEEFAEEDDSSVQEESAEEDNSSVQEEPTLTDHTGPEENSVSDESSEEEADKDSGEEKTDEEKEKSENQTEESSSQSSQDPESSDKEDDLSEEEKTGEGGIKAKLKYGWDFLHKPSVKKLIGKLMKSIKKIIKHLLPRDLQIDANLGFDDPSTTGTIMQLAAVLYAIYGEHIRITGDFEEQVMEGKVSLKGRIVLGYLLIKVLGMAIRILLNKECRALYNEIRKGNLG